MRVLPALTCALALAGGLLAPGRPAPAAQGEGPVYVPGQYIVVLKRGAADPGREAARLAGRHGLAVGHVYRSAIRGFSATIPAQRLQAMTADPQVAYVEQDQVVTAFPAALKPAGKGRGGSQPAQTIPTGIGRVDAELSATARIDGVDERVDVDIAILDTGIDLDHPDLNVVGGHNCANGRSADDKNGHGTHVAGTTAAKDNGIGVVGAAPGARLWAVRVLDANGSGFLSWIICGVDWVTANAAVIDVANMSLGFSGSSTALNTAIANSVAAGVTYAVAAGNSSADAAGFSPANHSDVITVSAIADSDGNCGGLGPATSYGADDTFATFSNNGPTVEIAAPGVDILSTYKDAGYARASGTSMASPHVAGGAALYRATHPGATPADVMAALLAAAVPQGDGCPGDGTSRGGFTGDPDAYPEPLLNTLGL